MAFPANEKDIEVCFAYGANLASPLAGLTYGSNLAPTHVKPSLTIARGRIGDSVRTQPTAINFGLKNPGGVFSPRNITGPNYGRLRRNTPVRVRLDPGSGMVTRGIAYMPDWPTRWTGPDIDDQIAMEASGALRRLGVGQSKSALLRTITAKSAPAGLVAYWPLEDEAGATQVASGLSAGAPGVVLTGVTPGGSSTLVGASRAMTAVTPDLDTAGVPGNMVFSIPSHTVGTETVTFWVQGTPWQAAPTGGVQVSVQHSVEFASGSSVGKLAVLLLSYDPASGLGTLRGCRVICLAPDGSNLGIAYTGALLPTFDPFDGAWHELQLRMVQSGSDVVLTVYADGVLGATKTLIGVTLGPMSTVIAGAAGTYLDNASINILPKVAPYSIGALCVHSASPTSYYQAGIGYPAEPAATRVARLGAEDGITVDVAAGVTEPMGQQLPGTTVDLLRECEDSDEGTLIERRTGELGFDPRSSRYNRSVVMTVNYLTQIADLVPDDGDRDLVNYATVTRIGGSSATVERTDGPLGTDQATGVDRYPTPYSRSLATDGQTVQHASFLVRKGTVDEPRYVVGINLRAHPELIPQWLACDIGSRFLATNPPAIQVGPAPLDLVIQGYTELLDGVEWFITIYATPYRINEVWQVENGAGNRSRIPAGVSTTDLAYSATASSLSVTSAATRWVDSATYAAKFPIVIEVAGEVMTCTSIVGTGLTQTFTVTRGLHGVTKALPIGSPVQVWRAPGIAL